MILFLSVLLKVTNHYTFPKLKVENMMHRPNVDFVVADVIVLCTGICFALLNVIFY